MCHGGARTATSSTGKVVKNVGYDSTHLLVGSEAYAVIILIILRLVPKPPVQSTLRATFRTIEEVAGRQQRDQHEACRRRWS